jgi:hypothetical protein
MFLFLSLYLSEAGISGTYIVVFWGCGHDICACWSSISVAKCKAKRVRHDSSKARALKITGSIIKSWLVILYNSLRSYWSIIRIGCMIVTHCRIKKKEDRGPWKTDK